MRAPEFRLRTPSAGLLALPWDRPLSQWNVPDVPLRDIAVGPSRHLVKFVEADDALWAVKDMPQRIAAKEYDVLRRLEEMGLPAVRPAGLVAATRVRHRDPGHPLPRGVLAVPPAVHAAAARPTEAPRTPAGCNGGPVGGTASPRCVLGRLLIGEHAVLAGRPASCGLAGRRRDIRGAPNTEPWAAQARPRNSGGERGDGLGRPRRAARSARGDAPHPDRRGRTGSGSATKRCGRSCTPSRCSGSAIGTASKGPSGASTNSASPSTNCRCNRTARTRAGSNSVSPWATGATTRSTFRSSPAWTSVRDRPASCSAICAPIRRSCAARSGTTSTSGRPHGCG